MRRGSRLLLILLLVVVLVGVGAFFFLGGNNPLAPRATPTPPLAKIVVAKQPIARDAELTEDLLTTIPFPQDKLPSQIVTDPKTIVGKFAKYPLSQGMPITTDMVADDPGALALGSDIAKKISPGLVAITIPVASRINVVAYAPKEGDRVSVIATSTFVDIDGGFQSILPNQLGTVSGTGFIKDELPKLTTSVGAGGSQGRTELDPTLNQAFYVLPSEAQRPRLVSQMILQNVQVLKLGNFSVATEQSAAAALPRATPTPQPGQTVQAAPSPSRPDVITLIVTPQDAITLTYLIYSGAKLTIVLRSPDDDSRVETEAATLQYLLSQYAIPVPAKLPYGLNPRLDELVDPKLPNDTVQVQQ